jgi:hypothetical protein
MGLSMAAVSMRTLPVAGCRFIIVSLFFVVFEQRKSDRRSEIIYPILCANENA